MISISVAKDFSRFPGGRYSSMSKHSGEEFREKLLLPAIAQDKGPVRVDLDGVRGYGSSFLEEVFGGVVRAKQWNTREEVARNLTIQTSSDSLRSETEQYIVEALQSARAQ